MNVTGSTLHVAVCTHCKVAKPATIKYFGPKVAKRNGLDSWCRDCLRARARVRQAHRRIHDREKLLAEKRRHRFSPGGRAWKRATALIENHKRRGGNLPFQWTLADWEACLEFWNHQCAYCGRTPVEQDHVVPLVSPDCPGTVPWNMAPACTKCNRSRSVAKVVSARLAAYLDSLRPSL